MSYLGRRYSALTSPPAGRQDIQTVDAEVFFERPIGVVLVEFPCGEQAQRVVRPLVPVVVLQHVPVGASGGRGVVRALVDDGVALRRARGIGDEQHLSSSVLQMTRLLPLAAGALDDDDHVFCPAHAPPPSPACPATRFSNVDGNSVSYSVNSRTARTRSSAPGRPCRGGLAGSAAPARPAARSRAPRSRPATFPRAAPRARSRRSSARRAA